MGIPSTYEPRGLRWLYRLAGSAGGSLTYLGHFVSFVYLAVRYLPAAIFRYRRQAVATVTDLAWGRGAVIVGGGTSLLMVVLGLAAGATVALIAHGALSILDLGAVAGAATSFAITREFAPLLAAAAFAVQAGCRMTAEIGRCGSARRSTRSRSSACTPSRLWSPPGSSPGSHHHPDLPRRRGRQLSEQRW